MRAARTRVVLVTEDEIKAAQTMVMQHLKILLELSSAVPVAALAKSDQYKGKNVGVILSGGNVSL